MGSQKRNVTPGFVAVLAAAVQMSDARAASASPPAPELMVRLADYAARLDSMRTHASYRFEGELSTLNRAGEPDSVKAMKGRVDADGHAAKLTVIQYTEDGEDKTLDAQRQARDREKSKKEKRRIRIPMLATEQPRYVFDQLERDPADPARVKISFVPRTPDDDTIEGSAWVDTQAGSLISAGFKLSKTSMFVDYVHFTVEFGEATALGAAVSKVHVEGQGGILFFRKRFRGTVAVSGYAFAP